jgi:hypothetical protein
MVGVVFLFIFSLRLYIPHVLKPVRLGNAVEELVVGVMLGTMVMGTEVMIVEP